MLTKKLRNCLTACRKMALVCRNGVLTHAHNGWLVLFYKYHKLSFDKFFINSKSPHEH